MGSFLGGRSDRWEYWTSVALLTVAGITFNMLHMRAAIAALFVMWMVTWARRLHDIGIAGWIALIPGAAIVVPVLLGWMVGGAAFLRMISFGTSGRVALLGYVVLSFIIQYGFTIWLGIKAGDAEENRFGMPHRPRIAEVEK